MEDGQVTSERAEWITREIHGACDGNLVMDRVHNGEDRLEVGRRLTAILIGPVVLPRQDMVQKNGGSLG